MIEAKVQADHVQLVVNILPKYAISNFMRYLKGKLATHLLNRYEHLRKRLWGVHLWSRGHCVITIGLDEEKIGKYIQWNETNE